MATHASNGASIRARLPRHLQLKSLKVKDPTLKKYTGCVDQFLEVARNNRWDISNVNLADVRMSEYFAELCESGAAYNTASYTLFGYLLLRCDENVPDRQLFPRSRAALKGWSSRYPQCSRTGADPLIWYLIADVIADSQPPIAAALLLQLDTYARPSEILQVRFGDVVKPVSKVCSYWGIIFGNSDRGAMTKAKLQDDTVLLDSLDRSFAPSVLKIVVKKCRQKNELIFGVVTLKEYEDAFHDACCQLGLAQFKLVPHCVRHSGPSVDFLQRSRSATEIQTRGRWSTQKSILRYQKPGQMLARMSKIPGHIWDRARTALPSVMRKLKAFYK